VGIWADTDLMSTDADDNSADWTNKLNRWTINQRT
jgi:hypothetical protein